MPGVRSSSVALAMTVTIGFAIGVLTLAPLAVPQVVPGTDKLHHLFAFAALTLPAALLSPRLLIWLLPASISYGGLIEVVQPFVGRLGEWLDFRADALGVVIGITIGLALRKTLVSRWQWLNSGSFVTIPKQGHRN